jgi:hypothetical protein
LIIQKTDQPTSGLNDTVDKMDLTGIYRIFHSTSTEYTFFAVAPGTIPKGYFKT